MLPDIREVIQSLSGKSSTIYSAKGNTIGFQWLGLRQVDYTKKCLCTGILGTSDCPTCSRCMSTGYLFSDFLVKGYMWMGILGTGYNSNMGLLSTQIRNVVVEHNRPINKFDYILELDQDPNTAKVRQPFKILKYYHIQDSVAIKGDSGRVEFWKCNVEERNIKDGRPGIDGTGFRYQGNRSNNEPQ
jgi:hypothetical protein